MHARAEKLRAPLQIAALVLFAVASVLAFTTVSPAFAPGMFAAGVVFAVAFTACVVASLMASRKGSDLPAFILQSAAAVCLVGLAAVSLFPNLVVAAPGSVGATITLASAASSDAALAWMTGIACVGVPLVLAYHVIAYRVFRGRLSEKDVA